MKPSAQNGNALWMILIAIALLGAITAMFTRSGGTSDDTGDFEQNSIAASEIMRYATSLEFGAQNLLNRGCSENDISFWNDSNGDGTENGSDDFYNANSPKNRSCHMFYAAGAGLPPPSVKTAWLDTSQSAAYRYKQYLFSGGIVIVNLPQETEEPELVYLVPYISKALCSAINQRLGISSIPLDHSVFTNHPAYLFKGSYSVLLRYGDDGATYTDNALIQGRPTLCIQSVSAAPVENTYHFYHTLLAR